MLVMRTKELQVHLYLGEAQTLDHGLSTMESSVKADSSQAQDVIWGTRYPIEEGKPLDNWAPFLMCSLRPTT